MTVWSYLPCARPPSPLQAPRLSCACASPPCASVLPCSRKSSPCPCSLGFLSRAGRLRDARGDILYHVVIVPRVLLHLAGAGTKVENPITERIQEFSVVRDDHDRLR